MIKETHLQWCQDTETIIDKKQISKNTVSPTETKSIQKQILLF